MKKTINMPREGTLVSWAKKPGEKFEKGDVLFEIEAEKAVMEIEAQEAGIMCAHKAEEGDTCKADETVGEIEVQ